MAGPKKVPIPTTTVPPAAPKKGTQQVTLQEVVDSASAAGIPDSYVPYFVAIIQQESGGHYDASPNTAGAIGPAQILNGAKPKPGQDLHAWALTNLKAGAKHFLGNITANSGNIDKAIAAYYTGQGNVDKHGISSGYGSPTPQAYVDSVKQIAALGASAWDNSTPQAKALHAQLVNQAKSASGAFIQSQVDLGAATAQAKAVAHVSDPWVTVVTDKKTGQTTLGQTTGYAPPKNVLTYGGEPLTKSGLSTVWSSQYANSYEQFTGKVATADVIVSTLQAGLSPFGLQQKLAQQKGFVGSPIWQENAPQVNSVAKQILGTDAPLDFTRKALSLGWNDTTVAAELRKIPQYLKGPEYQSNVATMGGQYKQIYGVPDATASQTIKEAAANGWTTTQFASYLRDQPEYKQSAEYQGNALSFLDAMGLLTGSRPTLTKATPITGGTAVPNAAVVPGQAKPLTSPSPFTASLGTAKGLT